MNTKDWINHGALAEEFAHFKSRKPFNYGVVENFLNEDILKKIEGEFLDFNSPKWFSYKNAIEDKKALNDWNQFPPYTYQLFSLFNSPEFVETLSAHVGVQLYADQGLHGGGWHIHGSGGNLNPHLDYSIHPKLGLQRKLNIIVYVSRELEEEHGGHLGIWDHNESLLQPGRLVKEIRPVFNRAVFFDTTQNSWHGMSRPLSQPDHIYRKSLAIYYLCDPPKEVDMRQRALFAPRDSQKDDKDVSELIKMRADVNRSAEVYRK